VSTDWHKFQTWLLDHGVDDPHEGWAWFLELAHSSSHADALAYISHGTQPLPDVLRLPILTGVASLMVHLENSPEAEDLCRQLAAALSDVLAEIDVNHPGTIAATLVLDPTGRQTLISWSIVVQIARVLLLETPRSEQIMHIAVLCNLGLERLVSVVRMRLPQVSDYSQVLYVTSRFGYALTLYTDAARRLNEELGIVAFVEPPSLGIGVDAP
jgi:hypothetical protein